MSVSINGGPAGLTMTAQVAFASNPSSTTPTWTDVSAYVLNLTIDRGKQHELDQVQTGTLNLTLKNTDGRFDPTNSSGPYFPNVVPMRQIQVGFTLGGTTHWVFTGYVERWPRARKGPKWSEVDLQASDAFDVFQNAVLVASLPQELTGTRIGAVLDAISWPSTLRSLAAGQSQVQASVFASSDQETALAHMQDVEASEVGFLFMGGSGMATFLDRHTFLNSPYNTSQATFSDQPAGGEIGYTDIVPSYDTDLLVNDWIVSAPALATAEVLDSGSIAAYFQRSQTRSTLLTTTSELHQQALYLLSGSKAPVLRYDSVTFRPGTSSTAWTQMLARDLGDRITVKEHPPNVSVFSQDAFIQHVHIEGGPGPAGSFTCRWGLYPADQTPYFVLTDPVRGQIGSALGGGNVLGY